MDTSIIRCAYFGIVTYTYFSMVSLLLLRGTLLSSQYPIMHHSSLSFRSSITPGMVSIFFCTRWLPSIMVAIPRLMECLFLHFLLFLGGFVGIGRPQSDGTILENANILGQSLGLADPKVMEPSSKMQTYSGQMFYRR